WPSDRSAVSTTRSFSWKSPREPATRMGSASPTRPRTRGSPPDAVYTPLDLTSDTIFEEYGLALLDAVPPALWRSAGDLKAKWRRISLADCFALALAIRENATLVTSDHRELDPIAESEICSIRFIR